MILFSGGGSIAAEYKSLFPCRILSARSLSDADLEEAIKSATVIIHNSALVQSDDLSMLIDSNFKLTKRLIDLVYKVNPLIRFINISSMSILSSSSSYLPTDAMTNYALSKYLSEVYCIGHKHRNVANVRFSTIFYKDNRKDGISKLAFDAALSKRIKIFNNGDAFRDIVPIDYIVRVLKELTEIEDLPITINIASGIPLQFQHFVSLLKMKIPDLVIDNEVADFKPVQYEFSNKYNPSASAISISAISSAFLEYLDSLNAKINL